jgi:hypothetical protein
MEYLRMCIVTIVAMEMLLRESEPYAKIFMTLFTTSDFSVIIDRHLTSSSQVVVSQSAPNLFWNSVHSQF